MFNPPRLVRGGHDLESLNQVLKNILTSQRMLKLCIRLNVMLLSSPEDDVKIKVIARADAGHRALGSKPRPYEGPGVEHAQQRVKEDLQMEKAGYESSLRSVSLLVADSEAIPLCPLAWEGGNDCWAGTR